MKIYIIYNQNYSLASVIESNGSSFVPPVNSVEITNYPNKASILANIDNYYYNAETKVIENK